MLHVRGKVGQEKLGLAIGCWPSRRPQLMQLQQAQVLPRPHTRAFGQDDQHGRLRIAHDDARTAP
eukprot:364509-Chlamydomonas_euryale.AAC.12